MSNIAVLELAKEIGGFIEHWGFKEIHGRVWTLIFMASEPIDANFLIDKLNVSKSLISMTLKDLIYYSVIIEAPKVGPTVCYIANFNIKDVIFDVLSKREAKILVKIKQACKTAEEEVSNQPQVFSIKRAQQVSKMVNNAEFSLKSLLSLKDTKILKLFDHLNLKDEV